MSARNFKGYFFVGLLLISLLFVGDFCGAIEQQEEEDKFRDFTQSSPNPANLKMDESVIKEFHFHVYFFQANAKAVESALQLRNKIIELNNTRFGYTVIPLDRVNYEPRGPHPIGSYENWVPIETFANVYQWFIQNHEGLSILVHPLSRYEIEDHSTRAAWIGEKLPLDLSKLTPVLDYIPLQYPELGLGYSSNHHHHHPHDEEHFKTVNELVKKTLEKNGVVAKADDLKVTVTSK